MMSSMEEVSMISNEGLNNVMIAEATDSNSSSSSNPCRSNKRQRQESARFKGVVLQQNGHWGAQIYANHSRFWIGTFKTEKEAAIAYDRAAIKLRSTGDFHRNFPSTTLTTQEQNFQDLYDKKTLLEMIKDGSYQPKFMDFLRTISIQMEKEAAAAAGMGLNLMKGCVINNDGGGGGGGGVLSRQLLFQKELTPSDVGKLNRLVIPKKYAVKHFPQVSLLNSEEEEDPDHAGGVDDVQLVFFDTDRRPWKFRYCYWKSSQSFVFTRGWNRFVREKKLKARDVITFNRCEHREWLMDQQQQQQQQPSFCVIEVIPSTTAVESIGGVRGYAPNKFEHGGYAAAGKMVLEQQLEFGPSIKCESSSVKDGKIWEEKEKQLVVTNGMAPIGSLPVVEKKGIRLFGVNIS